jgi:hypothetical protein
LGYAGYAFLEADLGGHRESPKATPFAELARVLVKHLAQCLGSLGIESPVNGVRMLRARPKCFRDFRESLLVEGMDGVARRLRIAAQLGSYLVGVFAPVAGEKYLATAQGEGIR